MDADEHGVRPTDGIPRDAARPAGSLMRAGEASRGQGSVSRGKDVEGRVYDEDFDARGNRRARGRTVADLD